MSNQTIEHILIRLINLNVNLNGEEYDKEISEISNEFIEYYTQNTRHSYSVISRVLYDNLDDNNQEDETYFYENIENIIRYIKKYDEENDCAYVEHIFKLEDHIKLELLRFTELKEKEQKINSEIEQKLTNSQKSFKKLDNDLKRQKRNIEGLNNQIIAILGIFSAIIITFFGGINFLEGTLSSAAQVRTYKLVLMVAVVGLVMFNIIFLLLTFIAKLVDKNLKSPCKCINYKNGKCLKEISSNIFLQSISDIRCFLHTSPYAFWINILLILIIIVSAISHLLI